MRILRLLAAGLMLAAFMAAPAFAGEDSVGGALVEVLHSKGVIDDASYAEIKKAGAEGGSESSDRKLLEVLYKKGVIDEATYKDISAKAEGEAKTVAAPQASAAPAERPFEKAFEAVEEGFAKLGGPDTRLKIGLCFQGGWLNDDAGNSVAYPPTSLKSTTSGNQFFVRRARLFFNGMLTSKVGYRLSFEGVQSQLQDMYVFADYIPYTRLTLGQFKQPFGLETNESIADIPTINRSLVDNFVQYPTLRDLGVMANVKYMGKVSGMPLGGSLWLAVVNGPGKNVVDDNDAKDFVARLTLTPLIEGLSVGGSLYSGKTHFAPSGVPDFNKGRDRYAAELDYNPPYVKGLKLRGEFMWDKHYFDRFATTKTTDPADFNRFAFSEGWYALAAYRVNGLKGFWGYLNGFEPVFRYEQFDEDITTPDNFRDRTTVGFNYYFAKYLRLAANYEIIHADGSLKTHSLETIDQVGHHLFTTLMQVKF